MHHWPSILDSKSRLEIALRVLAVSTVHGADPPPDEIAALRGLAVGERERQMTINALARQIISRECREIASGCAVR
jgi:hypothetical protein